MAEKLTEQEWEQVHEMSEATWTSESSIGLLLRALAEVQAEMASQKVVMAGADQLYSLSVARAEQAEAALAKVEKERDDATESEAVLARAIVSLQTALATERAQRGAMREAAQRVYDDVFINIVDTDQHFANWEALRAALAAQPPAPHAGQEYTDA